MIYDMYKYDIVEVRKLEKKESDEEDGHMTI